MTRQQRRAVDELLRRTPAGEPQTVEEMRTGFAAMMATMQVADGARSTPTTLAGLPALLVEPRLPAATGTILYFHGGGWVFGSPETAMSLTSALVERTGIRSISLDYRLAPEHPFPAAIEDGVAAFRALLEDGIGPSEIAFAGDSAGGGLCITTCLAARAAGLPMPAAVATFSAGLDHTRSGASMHSKSGIDPYFTRESLSRTGDMYLAGQDPNQELLTPATLGDLSGLPPLLLQVGTNEVLLDDSTRLAERARAVGVDVVLDVTAEVPHVFQSLVGLLDEADQALDRAACFLRQHVA